MIILENRFEYTTYEFLKGLNVKFRDDLDIDGLDGCECATYQKMSDNIYNTPDYDGDSIAVELGYGEYKNLPACENDFYIVEYDSVDLTVRVGRKTSPLTNQSYWLPLGLFEPTEIGLKQSKLRAMIERGSTVSGQIVKFISKPEPTTSYNWRFTPTNEFNTSDVFDKVYKIKAEHADGMASLESLCDCSADDARFLSNEWPLAALMIESVKEPTTRADVKPMAIDVNTIKTVREYLNGCGNSYRIDIILDLIDLMLHLKDVEPTFNNIARFLIDNDFDSVDMLKVLGIVSGYRVIKE